MAARINTVVDACVTAITAALPGGDGTTVSRDYLPDVLDAEMIGTLSGRYCFVFPLGYSQVEAATRAEDLNEYRVGVLVVERFTDAGDPSRSWTDTRLEWVQDQVYDVLGDVRGSALITGLYNETNDVTQAYDPVLLRSHKLFWSECEFAFRIHE